MQLFSIKTDRLEESKKFRLRVSAKTSNILLNRASKKFSAMNLSSRNLILTPKNRYFSVDNENKSFVIIEYKIDQSFSVIDQGYAYLGILLNNKAEFTLNITNTKTKA